eukprot:TRINITY_DN6528_c0_g1_i1.p1 TRINITY_DN6528_c0_g1~~TRINITY_DN6528_c0_g1_i1.p1  ORF type:complete len:201 (-),score=54.25 TRINITY_DN6528_c0_g1_i1:155-757(-)
MCIRDSGENQADLIDMAAYEEEVRTANEDKYLKKKLSEISRAEWPANMAPLEDLEYWRSLGCGLSVGGDAEQSKLDMDPAHLQACRDSLAVHGWFHAQPTGWTASQTAVANAIANLVSNGWPAVFVYIFDEPWKLLEQAWDVYGDVLDADVILEPTVYTWFLRPELGDKNRKSTSQNFGMPHRDYRYTCLLYTSPSPRDS